MTDWIDTELDQVRRERNAAMWADAKTAGPLARPTPDDILGPLRDALQRAYDRGFQESEQSHWAELEDLESSHAETIEDMSLEHERVLDLIDETLCDMGDQYLDAPHGSPLELVQHELRRAMKGTE
jgi:hypothetical protein